MAAVRATTKALTKFIISTRNAPSAVGAYNQAVLIGPTLYIAGQIGLVPSTMELAGRQGPSDKGDVKIETKQLLTNMGEILKVVGGSYDNVVKTTIMLANINDSADVNEIYKQFFTSNYPARAGYQVSALPKGALVEIDAIAVIGEISETKIITETDT